MHEMLLENLHEASIKRSFLFVAFPPISEAIYSKLMLLPKAYCTLSETTSIKEMDKQQTIIKLSFITQHLFSLPTSTPTASSEIRYVSHPSYPHNTCCACSCKRWASGVNRLWWLLLNSESSAIWRHLPRWKPIWSLLGELTIVQH